MNFTPQQWLICAVGMLGALAGVSAQLTTLFGQMMATNISSGAAILVALLTVPLGMMSGQAAQVKAVAAMPGVEKVQVNAKANQVLAAVATDEDQTKVEAIPGTEKAVQQIAKGG